MIAVFSDDGRVSIYRLFFCNDLPHNFSGKPIDIYC